MMAALVPLALLLGPMVVVFCWLPERMDPLSWNAEPGSPFNVVAAIDSDWRQPVTLKVAQPLYLDQASQQAQTLPKIRETLETLYAGRSASSNVSGFPWEVQEAARRIRSETLADLAAYLKAGVPPQYLGWRVRAREGAAGKFPISLETPGHAPMVMQVVLGDKSPPAPRDLVNRDFKSPVRTIAVVHAKPSRRRVFWAPLAIWGRPDWDSGWLLVYLLGYIPPMVVLRRVLRIP
jgi:hypothetical protein